jgi:hypothetical protein
LLAVSPVRAPWDWTEMSILLAMVATSVRASHRGLPTSSAMIEASSSLCSFSRSRKRVATRMRSSSGVSAQDSKLARAAAAARATSSAVEALLVQVWFPVDGSMVTSSRPLPASHAPPM